MKQGNCWPVWALMCGTWMLLGGCVVDAPSLESLTCTDNAMTPEAECVDGQWVMRASGASDMPDAMDMPPDLVVMPDLSPDMIIEPMDMPDAMPDASDMPPDLGDPCSEANVRGLCGDAECGTTAELSMQCPQFDCGVCRGDQQCVEGDCIGCLDFGTPAMVMAREDGDLCLEAAQRIFGGENNDQMNWGQAIMCGAGASVVSSICGLERELDCEGVCPAGLMCGDGDVCCYSEESLRMQCQSLSVAQRCGFELAIQDARRCDTGQLVDLSELCGDMCPLSLADSLDVVGRPTSGASGLIESPPRFPGEDNGLNAGKIELWLRATGGFFDASSGSWTAVTGPDSQDTINTSLFNSAKARVMSVASPDINLASALGSMDTHVNFNPYVDLAGGFVEFARPDDFKDDVTVAVVIRNKMGDEVDTQNNERWYQRSAVLSGEHGGGETDFGLTLNQGALEWSPRIGDTPVITSSPTVYQDELWRIVMVTRQEGNASGNGRLYVDGSLIGTGKHVEGSFGNPVVRIGRQPDPHPDEGQWHGDVAEAMLFSSVLSTSERRRVQTYLAVKYGITLQGEDYHNFEDTEVYNQSGQYTNRVFGIMCDANSFAIAQHTSRSNDGLWEMRAQDIASGLSACPTSPSQFSVLMGDNGGDMTVSTSAVMFEDAEQVSYPLEVVSRTWSFKLVSNGSTPVFTLKLNTRQPELVSTGFVPEMLLLADESGAQFIVPVTAVPDGVAVTFADLLPTGLDLSGEIRVQLARFER